MTELEVITAAVGGLAALLAVAGTAAVSRGWIEGSVTVKVVPPWKRRAPEPRVRPGEAPPAAELDGAAGLPERGAVR